ncbi:MAG TPA: hypothetical protein VF576_00840 [Rubricoccaceae bacterium]|jgi:hypothetical protein
MQQTLLALCAVLVFSIYALNQHRDDAAFERSAVTSESEGAAAEVARGRIAAAERLAFDEQDIGRTGIRLTPSTSAIGPDGDETEAALFDDLDDLNGLVEERSAQAGDGLLRFTVTYAVRYVAPATLAAAATPTLAKEVHVRAVEVTTGRTDRPPVSVDLRKVFTPAGMTSFRR